MTTQSEVLNNDKYIPVLNLGFVGLVDHMGNDDAIAQAARVSYGKGTKKISEDRALIRYLVRHLHTTPLEMVDFKFHIKCPIFVARQWIRHRTASINEYSARYSEMPDESFVPAIKTIKPQSTDNKQGRAGEFTIDQQWHTKDIIEDTWKDAFESYRKMLNSNVAKETARVVLPVSAYTEFYWKMNLHNLLHFLKLRLDKHAQYEIRVFAEAVFKLIQPVVPIATEAFTDYIFDGQTYANYQISRFELGELRDLLTYLYDLIPNIDKGIINSMKSKGASKREIDEFLDKFQIPTQ